MLPGGWDRVHREQGEKQGLKGQVQAWEREIRRIPSKAGPQKFGPVKMHDTGFVIISSIVNADSFGAAKPSNSVWLSCPL